MLTAARDVTSCIVKSYPSGPDGLSLALLCYRQGEAVGVVQTPFDGENHAGY